MGIVSSEVPARRAFRNATVLFKKDNCVKNTVVSSSTRRCQSASGKAVARPNQKKAVSFRDHETIREYDASDFDPADVYSQIYELEEWKSAAVKMVRTNHENDPQYREKVLRAFRTRNYSYTEDELDMFSASICRGLERKLSNIFFAHRQWTVHGVLKMQETTDNHACLRFFSKRASQPCVDFARMLAAADRKAADRIYGEDDELSVTMSSDSRSTNYWSDSSRSLESAETIDTI